MLAAAEASHPHVKSMREEKNTTDLLNTNKMVKEVHGFWGAEYIKSTKDDPEDDDLDFRFEIAIDADLGVGYEGLIFYTVREGRNLLVLNPNAFAEIASHSWITFKLYFIEWRFSADITGYKITPLDY